MVNTFFSLVTNTQAYQRKTEKFFVSEEKSLVGSTPEISLFDEYTCQPEHIFDREPHDANGLNHGQLRIIGRVSVGVNDAHRWDGVGRHACRRQDHECDGDDAHKLKTLKIIIIETEIMQKHICREVVR